MGTIPNSVYQTIIFLPKYKVGGKSNLGGIL